MDITNTDIASDHILRTDALSSSYGKHQVLHDVSINVRQGEIVGICGHNGAGKTTLLKSIFGIHQADTGDVFFKNSKVNGLSTTKMTSMGMSFTPSERPLFRDLTIIENLQLGAHVIRNRSLISKRIEEVLEIFPILAERRHLLAGRLSGGQQRQLSLGMALMVQPSLMILDEPSLGISPAVVSKTFEIIKELSLNRGMSVLLVEQNVKAMVSIADRVYVLRNGEIVLEENGDSSRARTDWWHLF
jgi:branched-chain amino acid transport system ATP-binding protein